VKLNPNRIAHQSQGCLPSEVLLTKEGEATLGKGTKGESTRTANGVVAITAKCAVSTIGVDDAIPGVEDVCRRLGLRTH